MIYDCFTFFNELELLDLRLHELNGVVDKFVLVEAAKTFTGKPKPLHYQDNRARFSPFQDKIIPIVVEDMPAAKNPWVLERFQRNAIARGLTECQPDDLVLISDLDEIPRATTVAEMRGKMRYEDTWAANLAHAALNSTLVKWLTLPKDLRWKLRRNNPFIYKFHQTHFTNYLNCRFQEPPFWFGTRLLYYRDFSCAEEVRHSGYKVVEQAGWHFTYMGGADRVRQKLEAYAHQENNLPQHADPQTIDAVINRGESVFNKGGKLQFVPLDDSFPRYLLNNRAQYASWIKPL